MQRFYPQVLFAVGFAVGVGVGVAVGVASVAESGREKKGMVYEGKRKKKKKREVSKGEKKREVYAVFETVLKGFHDGEDEYLIYKLDSVDDGEEGADGEKEFGQPIGTLKLADHPLAMDIFSLGSKIYFCGGFGYDPEDEPLYRPPIYSPKAYMFDVTSNQGIIEIESMHSPKPIPYIFGPDMDDRFYVYSAPHTINKMEACMDCLDTHTNKGENVWLPDHLRVSAFDGDSVVCGSNILLASKTGTHLFVFCTRSKLWRVLPSEESTEPHCLPFTEALYLCSVKNVGHLLFGAQCPGDLPELYLSAELPPFENGDDQVGPFKHLGIVEGLNLEQNYNPIPELLGGWGWGIMTGFYYFNTRHFKSICVVRTQEPGSVSHVRRDLGPYDRFVIDIYDVNFSGLNGSTEVKAMVENTLQYRYISKILITPRHFLAVG